MLNKEDEKSTMSLEESLMGTVIKVVATECITSPKSKRNINGFQVKLWLERSNMVLEIVMRKKKIKLS